MDLKSLSPAALKAAMQGGNQDWGMHGSADLHVRYAEAMPQRRLCTCGCRKRRTHIGMANGMGLYWGCELSVRRWVKTGAPTILKQQGGES